MLTTYIKRQTTQATYYAGPAGPYLDEFTNWLAKHGYRHDTIRHRLPGVAQLATWAKSTGYGLRSLSPSALEDFRRSLSKSGQLLISGGQRSVRWHGAQLFFEFFQAQQLIAPVSAVLQTVRFPVLQAFEE